MTGQVCVVAEVLRGEVTEITYTMLAAGRRLAEALKTELCVLVIGPQARALAGTLGAADRALCVEDASLGEFNPEAFLRVVAGLLKTQTPRVAMFGHTAIGTDLACSVARQLQVPVVTCCQTFSANGGEPRYSSLTCGGKLVAAGPLPAPNCVITVMPGGYKADEGKASKAPAIEALAVPAGIEGPRTRFKQYIDPPAGDVDISREAIVVSVGRGIQNRDNVALAETLASALGGVVAGSRPVVDQGWLPTSRLVGKSGKQVRPKLYLAVGISGAPEHLEGIPDAELMIGINTDEKAPIFNIAHYGTTCDALKLMPILAGKLKKA